MFSGSWYDGKSNVSALQKKVFIYLLVAHIGY